MAERDERRNKRVGMAVSLGVHVAVLLLFAFLMAWRAPDPPLPEYGIELNFGTSEVGTGDVQPETPQVPTDAEEDPAPDEVPEVEEEVLDEAQETPVEDTPVQEETETPDEPVEQVEEVFEDPQSSDVVEEKKEEQPVVEEKKEDPKPVEETPKPVEEKEEAEKPATEQQKPVEKPDDGAKGETGESDKTNANQGDKTDEKGDQGNEEGNIEPRSLYGNPGGGGGSSLQLTGWTWDFKPAPKDESSETGRIEFEIRIDDQGEIITIKTIQSTVSPAVRKIYEDEVRKLTFSKTDNLPPAPTSVGRITFIIKAK